MLCLAPLIFIGMAYSIQTNWHHNHDISAPFGEIQTCQAGFGARLAASTQWVQAGPQYGYTVELGKGFSFTGQIHGGLGYSNTHYDGIRQVTLYNGGVDLIASYKSLHLKAAYDHMSNGTGFNLGNRGQDMFNISIGFTF